MTQQAVLRRDDISEFISKMYEGDLHAKRVLSLSNATLGVLTSASLAIHAVGQGLGPRRRADSASTASSRSTGC